MATGSATLVEETGLCAVSTLGRRVCPEVLSTLYAAHYRSVLQVCRRFFRQPEDAEDAAAEVFLKLHTVLEKKDQAHPFRPWVSQVAGRHCIDELRRRKREKRIPVSEEDLRAVPDTTTPSPLAQVLQKEATVQLRKQLDLLPKPYKISLMLRYHQGLSYTEVACRLKRGLPAVKIMLFRARKRLRRNLEHLKCARQGAVSGTSLPAATGQPSPQARNRIQPELHAGDWPEGSNHRVPVNV